MLEPMRGLLSRFRRRKTTPSMFGDIELVETVDGAGHKVVLLKLGESLQSATYHGQRWHYPPFAYVRSFDHLFEADALRAQQHREPISSILMLGGGGFSYPKHVLSQRADVCMDVVEIDPVMVDIARRQLHLDQLEQLLAAQRQSDRLRIFVEDGAGYLRRCTQCYDAIINDTFEGDCAVCDFLIDDGIALVKAHLSEGGMYLCNYVVDFTREGLAGINGFVERLMRVFSYVCVVDACDNDFGGADNYLVIASDVRYEFSDVIPF